MDDKYKSKENSEREREKLGRETGRGQMARRADEYKIAD